MNSLTFISEPKGSGREYPILFSDAMVRANLSGRKSQTRRLRGLEDINSSPDAWEYLGWAVNGVQSQKGGEAWLS